MNSNAASQPPTDPTPLVQATDVRTWFPVKKGILRHTVGFVRAVDGVSFTLARGETLGLVGESGCGKTTLGRTILGLERPHGGDLTFRGRPLSWWRNKKEFPRKVQIIFQDPYSSLNPRMTILDILTEGLAEHGLLKQPKQEAAAELLSEVGLDPGAVFRYPHEFSGGQRQRVNVARAISLRPDLVVCDEPVSALDVSVQAQVIRLLISLREKHGLSYIFISHDLAVVKNIAHKVAVMYLGQIMETGSTREVLRHPRHPYTRALISAVPQPGKKKAHRIVLSGEVPSPADPPAGCPFHTRCPQVMDTCTKNPPPVYTDGGVDVACHLFGK